MKFEESIAIIKERIDITQVIGKYVSLKRHGLYYIGLCPFHKEKTASFFVYPDRGFYKCFGCGEVGDVFNFLQKKTGELFIDIVKKLSEEVGIKNDFFYKTMNLSTTIKKKRMIKLLNLINDFFNFYLFSNLGKNALNYLIKIRKIKIEIIKSWGIGFCPLDKKILINFLRNIGCLEEEAIDCGILKKGYNGLYIFFSGRIIFPIFNHNGSIVAFAGRIFEKKDNRPKYLNSPQSLLYNKSKIIFGLNKALPKLKQKAVVLVEGYFDAIAVNDLGFPSIACCGTCFTEEHIIKLKKYCNNIILCFDKDEAGKKAEEKALFLLLSAGFNVLTVNLTGKDPDELVNLGNKDELIFTLNNAKDAIQAKILKISRTKYSNIFERIIAIDRLLYFLKINPRELVVRNYVRFAAKILGEDEFVLLRELKLNDNRNIEFFQENQEKQCFTESELLLLQAVLAHPHVIKNIYKESLDSLNNELQKFLTILLNKINLNPTKNEFKILRELKIDISINFSNYIKKSEEHQKFISDKVAMEIIISLNKSIKKKQKEKELLSNYNILLQAEISGDLKAAKNLLLNQSRKLRNN